MAAPVPAKPELRCPDCGARGSLLEPSHHGYVFCNGCAIQFVIDAAGKVIRVLTR